MTRRSVPIFAAVVLLVVAGAEGGPPVAPSWAAQTESPKLGKTSNVNDAAIASSCGGGIEASLVVVANELAQALATRGELPDAQEIEWRQRKAGSPHVWPKTWGAHVGGGGAIDRKVVAKDVATWLGTNKGRMRCGVGSAKSGSGTSAREAIAVVAVDPIADLAAIPTRAKLGAWIDVDATLLRGAQNGRVVLLPPIGAPKTILSSTSEGWPPHVHAKFALGKVGRHVVQILADDVAGPRPVLEAEVWAGMDPPQSPPSSAAPGEEAGDGIDDVELALFARLNGARTSESQPKLLRDAKLDGVARAHAIAMMKAKLLGHDVGDGDPATRVAAAAAGKWKVLGENVAKAKTEKAAHRALYASPSHRSNMLDARFKKVGIAAAVDGKTGDIWVAQLYGG